MATREELHALLDELDSDELPSPEVLRAALERSRWMDPVLPGFLVYKDLTLPYEEYSAEGSAIRRGDDPPHIAVALGRGLGWTAARREQIKAILGSIPTQEPDTIVGRQEPPRTERAPAVGTAEEQRRRSPRKLPRSLAMGKGPADLSEREGFASPGVGEPH